MIYVLGLIFGVLLTLSLLLCCTLLVLWLSSLPLWTLGVFLLVLLIMMDLVS
jgi:hypothetical protein